ncbi:endonuclease/exonuclease/phosphatase family protein [Sediminibacterium sp.]|uniref:endonuclease/exonuclease/phosphatase family protein n=1 Tax=Sediminibacterium sp. TaxID=1917865 RepID=UPI0027375B3C|nr:endonuclease/exonuclease/phosphatase family protein [Sediminibacterium sp.]MDP3394160.1 endonuclease/exonuclease/phosphatase family protein [Sediminibacterium sp.]MDP3566251.1 endonuclease/exonuclease/phosphatase family protein [Sediminibacterium sp.]
MRNCLIWVAVFLFITDINAQSTVKAMSFNIRLDAASDGENRWDLRKNRVADLMQYYEPDFIGAQEVLHHQLAYLDSSLVQYSYIGVGRDDGKTLGEYSCIFYNQDKYTPIKQSTFWLAPKSDSVCMGWDAVCNRVCTYGLFKNKKTNQVVWVFNTHFDHVGKTARIESAKLILQKIKELNVKNDPVILLGDFNLRPTEEPIQKIASDMNNARAISKMVYGNIDTWNGFKFKEKPNGGIDYIFVNKHKRIVVEKFATITDSYDLKYPSDHFPVMATITLLK